MTKSIKTLIGVIVIAAVILVIAATTKTTPVSNQADLNSPATLTLVSPFGGTAEVGKLQGIAWTSRNYGSDTIAVNIIRKISDNPSRYELVRTVSIATLNDGSAVWVPALTDVGSDIYVEVACAVSGQACTASASTASLAVLDTGRYDNTASVLEAIEAAQNK